MNTNTIGNTTTIIKWISMTLAGYLVAALATNGITNVDTVILSEIIGALLFLILGYLDSKYPNTFKFLDNQDYEETIDDDVVDQ